MRTSAATVFAALTLASLPAAQVIIVNPPQPVPPIRIHPRPVGPQVHLTTLAVVARVQDAVATTELRQVFRNDGAAIGEGEWILPLPPGVTTDKFTMTVAGKEVEGEVLPADKARAIYEAIVRRQRDPGLLEYLGTGMLRARVFPIPAHGEITATVRYRQVLDATSGLHRWWFPLRAAAAGGNAPGKVSLDFTVTTTQPLKNVWSPLGAVQVVRKSDHEARASFEGDAGQIAARDVSVYFGLSEQEFGLNLLSYAKAGQPGWFLMLLAPKHEWPEAPNVVKSVQLVVDTSGSMQGKKIEQAKGAVRFFLRSLKAGDLFNVIPFATEANPFFEGPRAMDPDALAKALAKVDEMQARGGTNIEDALRAALAAPPPAAEGKQVVPMIVFVTDGQPTVGTTHVDRLLETVKEQNRAGTRIFVFGVGNDVNTKLLDTIAEQSRGDHDYVREDQDIEVETASLFTKLSHPVMTDVELKATGVELSDVAPKRLPDLFKGSRIVVAGRYTGSGHHAIELSGTVNGERKKFTFEGMFAAEPTPHDFVPALWAERRVAVLLDAIRLNGPQPELLEEVRRLGKEFGIVTPYTSHLIVEEGMQVAQARGLAPGADGGGRFGGFGDGAAADARRDEVAKELRRRGALAPMEEQVLADAPAAAARESGEAKDRFEKLAEVQTGAAAVGASTALRAAAAAPTLPGRIAAGAGVTSLLTQRVKDKTFHLVGGVWVDRAFTAEMRERVRKVQAFSDDWFALVRERPELAPYLAFSTRLVVVTDGGPVEITE